jgi:hypothetical protein
MRNSVDIDQTRRDIRATFAKWDIDPSEFEIVWEEERDGVGRISRKPGVKVRYLRNGQWQEVSCYGFTTRAQNLRQCYLLLDRLRIAEKVGVQYQGLASSKELVAASPETSRKQDLLDAYDILGVSPDDTLDLIKDIYRRKTMHYHPDSTLHQGGDPEKFKRLTEAYELVLNSRGAQK